MDTPSLGHHLAIGDRRQLALYSDSGAVEPVPLQLQMARPETCWTPSARMDRRSSTTYACSAAASDQRGGVLDQIHFQATQGIFFNFNLF